jgi:16S rRNA (adenine1518-N6/adenine1519-N6)-dimethyltransferase
MNLSSKIAVENLLEKYGIKPFKGWGQNFLINGGILKKITEAAHLGQNDYILEIGPGIGTLTQELAQRAKKVVAIEKDRKMMQILKETLGDLKNIEIINADALEIIPESLFRKNNYKVVANLPYNIASAAIRKFLESENQPKEMILMVQKEVAQRICSKPPKMNILAVSVQFYSKPKIISFVSKNSFWPRPKVDSAIIKITVNKEQKIRNSDLFFKIVRSGFSQPRKQLANNLSKELKLDKEKVKNWLLKNGVQPSQRAETLEIKEWINLAISFKMEL